MKRRGSLLASVVLGTVIGCANIAGVGDYKKEGEGGAALGAGCGTDAPCGAGLTCIAEGDAQTCRRVCFDLDDPTKQCGSDACLPVPNGVQPQIEAICISAGGNTTGNPCPSPRDCAPGFDCVRFTDGTDFVCSPYCRLDGSGAACPPEAPNCHPTNPSITIDGVRWGACGP